MIPFIYLFKHRNVENRQCLSTVQDLESKEKEGELGKLNQEFLEDQAAIFKNTALLNACKPTKEFLTMEQRKEGYCNISKLRVETTDEKTKKKLKRRLLNHLK